MKKRILSLILVVCAVFTLSVGAFADSSFSDVKEGSWYFDNVTRMASLNMLNGYPDGSFRPAGTITNGEFLTVLMKALSGSTEFEKTGEHWASGVLSAAVNKKVCSSDELTEEDLDTLITRAEAAKYTFNAVKNLLHEKDVDTNGISSMIVDMDSVKESGCSDQLIDVYARGIVTGDDKGRFNPASNISRCEAATLVLRAYDASIRVLPFGIADSLESVFADRGVMFLNCFGSKYDVKSMEVMSLTANGIKLDISCTYDSASWKKLISSSTKIKKAYSGVAEPDAVVNFKWDADRISAIAGSTFHDSALDKDLPVIDFELKAELTLSNGETLIYTGCTSYAIADYGGLL